MSAGSGRFAAGFFAVALAGWLGVISGGLILESLQPLEAEPLSGDPVVQEKQLPGALIDELTSLFPEGRDRPRAGGEGFIMFIGSPDCAASRTVRAVVEEWINGEVGEGRHAVTLAVLQSNEGPPDVGWIPGSSKVLADPDATRLILTGIDRFPLVLLVSGDGEVQGVLDPIKVSRVPA